MSTEQNKKIARDFLVASALHDGPTADALMHEDSSYWTCGKPHLFDYAGERNKSEFMKYAYSPSIFVGGAKVSFGAVTAEGDQVAIESEITGVMPDGRVYTNAYHYLFTFKDGKILRVKEYMDTQAAAEFFFQKS